MLEKILLIAELLLACAFIAAFPVFNAGNAAGLIFCAAAAIITADIFGARTALAGLCGRSLPAKAAVILIILLTAAGLVYGAAVSVKMVGAMKNAPEKDPELIIVLGCQVRGDRPSKMLARRLDTAYKAMERYPGAKVVVSGGKGDDEQISEAECMRRYLVSLGADESRIIMEDKSATTYENIRNTFAITDAMGLGRDVTIISDGFHQYRASLIARKEGAGSITAVSANTEPRFIPTYWVREWLALLWQTVKGN